MNSLGSLYFNNGNLKYTNLNGFVCFGIMLLKIMTTFGTALL